MKRLITSLVLVQALLGTTASKAGSFTYESPAELETTLDSNGDGRSDLLILDKATGVRQLGTQKSDGTFLWSDPASTGLDRIASLTAGRFDSNTLAEGFALAAPDWNQSLLFPGTGSDSLRLPTVGFGPNLVAAFSFTGGAVDDLVSATEWDNPPFPAQLGGIQIIDALPSLISGPGQEASVFLQGNQARFRNGQPWFLGALRDLSDGREFVTRNYSAVDGFVPGPTVTGLATNACWAWGEFVAGGFSHFLFYSPGSTQLRVPGLVEPSPSNFQWTAGHTFTLSQAIERVQVIQKASGALLLVIFADGGSAATYDFDGTSPPVLRQSLTPPSGMRFSVAAGIGNGNFALMNGSAGGAGGSTGWQRWNLSGSKHSLASSGSIPIITPDVARANVLLFQGNPDVVPGSPLLRSLKVGDWSVDASLAGATLTVTREGFQGSSSGLGGTTQVAVNGLLGLPGDAFPEVNQRDAAVSAVFLGIPSVAPVPDINFLPGAGTYHLQTSGALQVHIATSVAGTVLFRTDASQPWSVYDPSTAIQIRSNTVLRAFLALDPPGPIFSAIYTIADAGPIAPSGGVDANHNGIPDDWENLFGISDPNGDADGDGATNLAEYEAGTDPRDPLSKPSGNPGTVVLIARAPGAGAPADTLCEIVWPSAISGGVLESSADLPSTAGWTGVAGPFTTAGIERIYYQPIGTAESQRFFRLRYEP